MKTDAKFFQQGDVLLIAVNSLPKTNKKEDNIVAEGEATGHMHRVFGEDAVVSVDKDGNIFVDAPNGATVTHDEHNTIEVPSGKFQIGIVQEYDALEKEARLVAD